MMTLKKRLVAAATILILGAGLGACSKCEMSGWLKSCGATAPKSLAQPL